MRLVRFARCRKNQTQKQFALFLGCKQTYGTLFSLFWWGRAPPYRATEIYDCLSKHLGVKYLFEGAPEPKEEDLLLTPEMLDELPDDLLVELQQALESLETERIGEVIRQIGEQDQKLQKKLSFLTGNSNYPAILNVLQAKGLPG